MSQLGGGTAPSNLFPQALIDQLNAAETALEDAVTADGDVTAKQAAAATISSQLDAANTQTQAAQATALQTHQQANEAASAALDAIRAHFGLPPASGTTPAAPQGIPQGSPKALDAQASPAGGQTPTPLRANSSLPPFAPPAASGN